MIVYWFNIDEDSKKKQEAQVEVFKPLTDYLKKSLEKVVEKVVLSDKLTTSPCAVVATEYGISGAMEKIILSRQVANDDPTAMFQLTQKKIFEINPEHPIIVGLLERVQNKADEKDEKILKLSVDVLYEETLLRSGYSVQNSMDFALRVERLLRHFIGIDPEKQAQVTLSPAQEEDEAVRKAHEEKLAKQRNKYANEEVDPDEGFIEVVDATKEEQEEADKMVAEEANEEL